MDAWHQKIKRRQQASLERAWLKQRAVHYLGGSCRLCGYNRSLHAFDFHHLGGSTEKDFTISDRLTMAWEKLQVELDKCLLLCATCHREVHDGLHPHLLSTPETQDESLYDHEAGGEHLPEEAQESLSALFESGF